MPSSWESKWKSWKTVIEEFTRTWKKSQEWPRIIKNPTTVSTSIYQSEFIELQTMTKSQQWMYNIYIPDICPIKPNREVLKIAQGSSKVPSRFFYQLRNWVFCDLQLAFIQPHIRFLFSNNYPFNSVISQF